MRYNFLHVLGFMISCLVILVEAIIYRNLVMQTANRLLLSNFPVLPAIRMSIKHLIDSQISVFIVLYDCNHGISHHKYVKLNLLLAFFAD